MSRNAPPKGGGALPDIPKIQLRRRLICLAPGPKWNPCFIFRTMSVASVAQFKTLTCLTNFCSSGWGILFSSPEATFLLVNTKNGDLWKGPKPEVRDSWTFHYSAHAQSQVEKIWLAESMKQVICTLLTKSDLARGRNSWCWPKAALCSSWDENGGHCALDIFRICM